MGHSQSVITTFAGNGTAGFSGDSGPATSAKITSSQKCLPDFKGNFFLSDVDNYRIRKIDGNGIITTIAGNGTPGNTGDGGQALNASISLPCGMVFDKIGNLYFCDLGSSCVRKIDTAGVITTVAGTGGSGYSGDNGLATAAQLGSPIGIAIDHLGNFYISDLTNCVIRKIDRNGIITTIVGTGVGGFTGDSIPAVSSQLSLPSDINFDKFGNLFIAEEYNYRIRKVDPNGMISTVAGNGTAGYSGDGGPALSASLNTPYGVVPDSAGNLYISDGYNNVIRKVDSQGVITTIIGHGVGGGPCSGAFGGDNGNPLLASLNDVGFLTFDKSGNLYIPDGCNYRIRKVSHVGDMVAGIEPTRIGDNLPNVFPNPCSGNFTFKYNYRVNEKLKFVMVNLMGEEVLNDFLEHAKGEKTFEVSHLTAGIYYYKVASGTKICSNGKIVIVR